MTIEDRFARVLNDLNKLARAAKRAQANTTQLDDKIVMQRLQNKLYRLHNELRVEHYVIEDASKLVSH